jgi:hypothetical protein
VITKKNSVEFFEGFTPFEHHEYEESEAYQASQYVVSRVGIFLGKWRSSYAGSSAGKMNVQSACALNILYKYIYIYILNILYKYIYYIDIFISTGYGLDD